ncbi:MAG: tRNA 4-thiouridine(8) synthase ThiI [Actinomycetia bacterium]|nr:tRNA 4-thiouridine(8) synthase ThiI [Actinomycetes bacterium]
MAERVCFISYHELGLKGKNRATFERRFQLNLDEALDLYVRRQVPEVRRAAVVGHVRHITGRYVVEVRDASRWEEISGALAKVPGCTSVTLAYQGGRDLGEIEALALRCFEEGLPAASFRVRAKRSNTDFEMTSMELAAHLGELLGASYPVPVKMKGADLEVQVTIVGGQSYVSARRVEGIGGLPTGSSGRIVSLLSSGIDSPVATWRMLRRGAVGIGLHFSGRPATSDASERLVAEIGEVLSATGGLARIWIVPFGEIQRDIAGRVYAPLRILCYRRMMLKVACALAEREGALALVTGESLGQVASQTLENITVTSEVADRPILRPLIGSDKQEIIAEARKIGTYELSIQDASDCCTLFMPPQAETHATFEAMEQAWSQLDVEAAVATCLNTAACIDFPCRNYPRKDRP